MLLEDVKAAGEKLTGLGRPKKVEPRRRKPQLYSFADDGKTPNNPDFPLVIYRSPLDLKSGGLDPAALFEVMFASHGWRQSWRDGMYGFNHFHTGTHEVLGIARGHVRARFGGARGRVIELRAGDVAILPAGTGHRRLAQSGDLLVVGAYPRGGKYDEPRPGAVDHAEAVRAIARVAAPAHHPVYGGPMRRLWNR